DPTGIGDNFRSGFIAGLSWGFNHERCAQLGSMLATYCLETKGTQEYRFDEQEFMSRFEAAYGSEARADIEGKIQPRMVG
ncbi:MAG: PfkB family carbohydrate kinase, partial [Actinomycetes bacterium]